MISPAGVSFGVRMSPTHGSDAWPWKGYCDQEAQRTRDVSLVSGVSSKMRENLAATGIRTVEDLADTPPAQLQRAPGIGEKRARGYINAATALVTGQPARIGSVIFPSPSVEIFLDLEGDRPAARPRGPLRDGLSHWGRCPRRRPCRVPSLPRRGLRRLGPEQVST